MGNRPNTTLSKTRFCYGLQCVKQLWWRVHDPKAPELVADAALQAVFDQGHRVGEAAKAEFPGGTSIGHEYWQLPEKVADTRAALAANAPVIFEAAFLEDGVFVAVDALERRGPGHTLVEVKSTTKVKGQHFPDVAIQLHVLRAAGLDVQRVELMHLNRDCRFPDLSDLFLREDVTREAEALAAGIPAQLAGMKAALAGKLPVIGTGPHCTDPYDCPFLERCWPEAGKDHVSRLYRGGQLVTALQEEGVESLREIPDEQELSAIQARQVRAVKTGKVVVEEALAAALATLEAPLAYLDFETIAPAIPVWPGCGPFMTVPVQLSCHVVGARGGSTHHEYLAEGPDDPRPAIAAAIVRACAGAKTVVAYNAPFERRCLEHLAENVPAERDALLSVAQKLVDLLPIVRNHVYHPDFGGGFGMKAVAPALVQGLAYGGLAIGDGQTAAAVLEEMLLRGGVGSKAEREALRKQLLEYCELDTLAMVKVVERLRELSTP